MVSVSEACIPHTLKLFFFIFFLTAEFTDELLHTFLGQRVLDILSLVFRFFLSESQTASVPRAELQRIQQEEGKRKRLFFISVRN